MSLEPAFYVVICAFYVLWLLPNGHQELPDSSLTFDSVEKVVSPDINGSFSGGAVEELVGGAPRGLGTLVPPIL